MILYSGYHPESWQPSWSIRTALLAIIGFMPTRSDGAIGGLDYTPEERKTLAKKSNTWSCPACGAIKNLLKPVGHSGTKTEQQKKDEALAKQINFSKPKSPVKTDDKPESSAAKSDSPNEPKVSTESENISTPPNTDGLRQRYIYDLNGIVYLLYYMHNAFVTCMC